MVYHRLWSTSEIVSKEAAERFITARKTVEEMARRATAHYASIVHQANAVSFKSNAAHDAYRAMVLRPGRKIVNEGGELVVTETRRQTRIYYRSATPTLPASRQRARGATTGIDTSGFLWIKQSEDANGGYETTTTNPGMQVNSLPLCLCRRHVLSACWECQRVQGL